MIPLIRLIALLGWLTVIIPFVITSCTLPQDKTPAPIANDLYTTEMTSCDRQEVGKLSCFFTKEQTGSLKINLWGKGEYVISSNKCNFRKNKRYEGDQVLEMFYKDLLELKPNNETQCLYLVQVFIDGLDRGTQGQFLLVNNDYDPAPFSFLNKTFNGLGEIQLKEGSDVDNSLLFNLNYPGLIFWEGCQINDEKRFIQSPEINFREIIKDSPKIQDSCILTIGIIPDDSAIKVSYVKFNIGIFSDKLIEYPEPVIKYKNERLKIKADKITAIIGINDKVKFKRQTLCKKIAKDEIATVRLMTSNGRYMLLKVKNGEVVWKNFLRY